MKILSISANISEYGGAQKVMIDLHEGLKNEFDCKILSFQPLNKFHSNYNIQIEEFERFIHPFQLNNSVLIVHSRILISFFVLLKKIFFLNTEIIFVSHSVYKTNKNLTIFPRLVVSISHKVTNNLKSYFKIRKSNVHLIYNGLIDVVNADLVSKIYSNENIKILYSARIDSNKRQVEIVERLKGNLSKNIQIYFAGTGNEFNELNTLCDGKQFIALGFISDINNLINIVDYVMLFSVQEGLPLSLIEGTMHGKPLIVNDVGGNLEIGIPGFNSILLENNIELLADNLNKLTNISSDKYYSLAKNSRIHYLEKFQYDNMIENYKKLIKSSNRFQIKSIKKIKKNNTYNGKHP